MEKTVYEKIKKRMSKDDITKLLKLKWKYKMGYRRMSSAENNETLNLMSDVYMNSLITNLSDVELGKIKKNEPWVFPPKFKTKLEILNTRRIFNSHKVFIEDFPFMASILIMGRFQCGGTIIHSDLVVTSAACLQLFWNNRFFRENPKVLTVRVGSDYAIVSGEIHDVLEIYFHPNYKPKTLENNIAIIRLEFHIKFNRRKKKIKIDDRKNSIPIDSRVYILGWGAKTHSNKVPTNPKVLQYGELPVYPNGMCREIYKGKTTISQRMFCAGDLYGTVTPCNHDEGGPAILDSHLVGVISFASTDCSNSEEPSVFTQVGYYSKWIESIINQNRPHPQKTYTTNVYTTMTTTVTTQSAIMEDAPIVIEKYLNITSRIKYPDNESSSSSQSFSDNDLERNIDLNEYYANEVEEPSLPASIAKIANADSIHSGSQSINDVNSDTNEDISEIDQSMKNRDLDYVTAHFDEIKFKALKMAESMELNFPPVGNNTVESSSPTTSEDTIDLPDKSREPIEVTTNSLPLTSAYKQLEIYTLKPITVRVSSQLTTLKSLMNLITNSRRPKKNTRSKLKSLTRPKNNIRHKLPSPTRPEKKLITLIRPIKELLTYTKRPITVTPRFTMFNKKRKLIGTKRPSLIKNRQFVTGFVKQSAMHHSRENKVPIFKIHSDEQIENIAQSPRTTVTFADASINKIASYLAALTKTGHTLDYSRALEVDKFLSTAKNREFKSYSNYNLKQIERINNYQDGNYNPGMINDHKDKNYYGSE